MIKKNGPAHWNEAQGLSRPLIYDLRKNKHFPSELIKLVEIKDIPILAFEIFLNLMIKKCPALALLLLLSLSPSPCHLVILSRSLFFQMWSQLIVHFHLNEHRRWKKIGYNKTKITSTKSNPYEVVEHFFCTITIYCNANAGNKETGRRGKKVCWKKRKICFGGLNGNNRKCFFSHCETKAIKIELMQAHAIQ